MPDRCAPMQLQGCGTPPGLSSAPSRRTPPTRERPLLCTRTLSSCHLRLFPHCFPPAARVSGHVIPLLSPLTPSLLPRCACSGPCSPEAALGPCARSPLWEPVTDVGSCICTPAVADPHLPVCVPSARGNVLSGGDSGPLYPFCGRVAERRV